MIEEINVECATIGVVGLGLMGSSIVVSLLASGHHVVALAPIRGEKANAKKHISDLLDHANSAGLLKKGLKESTRSLFISEDYNCLSDCAIVIECVIEDKTIKSKVYHEIASVVRPDTIIASNTSAIPISVLQEYVEKPERFMGIHWAEPAYATRFLEITCGNKTKVENAEMVYKMANNWGKEPTLLRKDIRGFITNRLMYAIYRESFALVESGKATMTDVDKVFKYGVGSWITLMGIFKRMDVEGLENSAKIINSILPVLSNKTTVPKVMQKIVEVKGRGIYNQSGLFDYTAEECKVWEQQFASFIKDISRLAERYPSI
jgi:3-hydroxybutyryl-CoA dehydrogenase